MTVSVLWLFLMVLWVGLQCVIVVFPDDTHLLYGAHAQNNEIPAYVPINVHVQSRFCQCMVNSEGVITALRYILPSNNSIFVACKNLFRDHPFLSRLFEFYLKINHSLNITNQLGLLYLTLMKL